MGSSETKVAFTICFVIACLVTLCLKGCSISEKYDAEIKTTAMNKGYIQSEINGGPGLKWVKYDSNTLGK
jgi:hypothetical protein